MTSGTLFQCGDFTLASGQHSPFKIECDVLSDDDLACIAELFAERLSPFGSVKGVPRGGERLAELMRCYITKGEPLLVVDDVWTTGVSMKSFLRSLPRDMVQEKGAVIFARHATPWWVTALFTMAEATVDELDG